MNMENKKEQIRVLHVIGSMGQAGAESMLMTIYRNIDRKKIQFDFIENSLINSYYDNEIRDLGGKIYNCPHYNGLNHISYIRWWYTFFRKHKNEYRVIHGHIGSTAAIYLSIAKKFGLYTIAHSHSSKMSIIYSIYSYSTRYIADYFFACSKSAAINRYGRKIYNSKRFKIINNAIEVNKYVFDIKIRNRIRTNLNLDNYFVIGAVGRLTHQKNPIFIVDVFEEVYKLNNNFKLLWIGDGEMKRRIENLISKKGLEESVILLGERNDVEQLLQAMDIFVMPSFSEGLGIAGIEAQTSGLTCLFSNRMPREVGIMSDCKFLPINNKKIWSNEIISLIKDKKDRKIEKNQIIKSGYDISNNITYLTEFYSNIK